MVDELFIYSISNLLKISFILLDLFCSIALLFQIIVMNIETRERGERRLYASWLVMKKSQKLDTTDGKVMFGK